VSQGPVRLLKFTLDLHALANIELLEESASLTDVKSQKAFETGLLAKTAKQTADIILYDNRIGGFNTLTT